MQEPVQIICPYCEETISFLAYNGEDYFCLSCDTTITDDTDEAHEFMSGSWDGIGSVSRPHKTLLIIP